MKISLATHRLQIREKYKTEEYIHFDNLPEDNITDLLECLSKCFEEVCDNNTSFDTTRSQKRSKLSEYNIDNNNRVISGKVYSGDYGLQLVWINPEREEEYEMDYQGAATKPFYFLIHLPEGMNEGYVLLEKKGTDSIKEPFTNLIERVINEILERNYNIEISQFVPQVVLESAADHGNLAEMRFISHTLPVNPIDAYTHNLDPEDGYYEVRYHFKNKRGLTQRLKDILMSKDENAELRNHNDNDFDKVKLEIEIGDSKRTFDVLDPENAYPYIDITNHLVINRGDPEFQSIDNYSKRYLNDVLIELGFDELDFDQGN